MHGLRHPVLPRGLPARQPHPRVERPRLPRRLVRGHRAAARHQQLPRVHRSPVPGAVRGGVRARDQRRPGGHRAHRVRDHRAGMVRGLGGPGPSRRADGQAGGGGGFGTRRPGRRPAAVPGRPHGGRLRAGRAPRRAAALRHPRVQDGEGGPRPPAGPDGVRGRGVPVRRSRWGRRRRTCPGPWPRGPPWCPAPTWWPTSTPWCWPVAPPCPATCRPRAASSTASTGPWTT